MDKRVLFAFLLIGIIILLTPKYQEWVIGKPSPPSLSKSLSDKLPLLSSSGSPSQSQAIEISRTSSVSQVQDRDVIIENEVFISRWNTRGGVLLSWVLKAFADGNRLRRVELLGRGGKGFVLIANGQDFSDFYFEPTLNSVFLKKDQSQTLSWVCNLPNGTIEKRLTFYGSRYDIKVEVFFKGGISNRKCSLEWRGGIGQSESNIADEYSHTKIVSFMGGLLQNWDIGDIKDAKFTPSGEGGWVGLRSKYFLISFVPEPVGSYSMSFHGEPLPEGGKLLNFGLTSDHTNGAWSGAFYGGPISYPILKDYFDGELHRVMNWGWEWSRWFMEPIGIGILRVFLAIHQLVPNYGLVIILFSILVKIALYPLTHKSYEASARMQEIQPKIAALKEKFQNDQQKMNQEMMRLYKEQGINPLGGCLPVLFQMPILFALFNVFQNAIELRQAPFWGWIIDLSQPEFLSIAGIQVHFLPILMAVSMFLQQKTSVKDPNQKMLVYLMPIMMIFFFWTMSSGLVLYWTMFNFLSWGQQVCIEQLQKRA
ncbi:MAG: membrane protein insertase YidC [Candidatus Peregrinibacteria bacterium]